MKILGGLAPRMRLSILCRRRLSCLRRWPLNAGVRGHRTYAAVLEVQMLKRLRSLVLSLAVLPFVALAQSPGEVFESDEILSAALHEVREFHRDQIESLISYLSACSPGGGVEVHQYECGRAAAVIEIKAAEATALKNLIRAITLHRRIVSRDPTSAKERQDQSRYIQREVRIMRRLQEAASSSYHALHH